MDGIINNKWIDTVDGTKERMDGQMERQNKRRKSSLMIGIINIHDYSIQNRFTMEVAI